MSELPLHYQDGVSIAKRIHAGELSSVEVTEALLARMDQQKNLGAFVTETPDLAMAQAAQADEDIRQGNIRSVLHGVPIAVKDLLATNGIITTNGMALYSDNLPDFNATVVERLSAAGTVLLGKLKLTEGAYSRHHPEVSPPVNAWDANCWTGVSSSGSGVATSAGLCFCSLGTDTGGSIRFPSASNGIVGLKPTWGRVSRHGAFPLAYSLDHIGPMTRSVADAAAMLGIIAGRDPQDPTSSAKAVPDYLAELSGSISNLRIGIDQAYVSGNTDRELTQAVKEVSDFLKSKGCELVDITIPFEEISNGWVVTTAVEAAHAHRDSYPAQKDQYGHIGDLLALGLTISAETYMQIELQRRAFMAHLEGVFNDCDLVLCPSMPLYAPPREGTPEMDEAEGDLAQTLKFTAPFDYSGSPTLSIPWRAGSKNIPLGIQLVGRHFEEGTLLRVGEAIEKERGVIIYPV